MRGAVRRIAPFLAISSNFDKPKCLVIWRTRCARLQPLLVPPGVSRVSPAGGREHGAATTPPGRRGGPFGKGSRIWARVVAQRENFEHLMGLDAIF